MQRYRLFQGKLREHADGEWVRYEDAAALLEACRAAIRVGFWGHHPDTLDSDEVTQVVEQIHAALDAVGGGR